MGTGGSRAVRASHDHVVKVDVLERVRLQDRLRQGLVGSRQYGHADAAHEAALRLGVGCDPVRDALRQTLVAGSDLGDGSRLGPVNREHAEHEERQKADAAKEEKSECAGSHGLSPGWQGRRSAIQRQDVALGTTSPQKLPSMAAKERLT
jgi:hypothetical protein